MFVGHYAPAAALKSATRAAPLWHFFVAVQLLDYLWAAFILSGIEKARIVPGFLAASDLDLYFMPYTHSFAAAAFWSAVAGLLYGTVVNKGAGVASAAAIAAAVFSHWLADLIVHASDLALYPGSPVKLGFGLWSSIALSQALELALFSGGMLLYVRATRPKGAQGKISLAILIGALFLVQVYNQVGEPPSDIKTFASLALIAYTAFAALAAWADRTRVRKGA